MPLPFAARPSRDTRRFLPLLLAASFGWAVPTLLGQGGPPGQGTPQPQSPPKSTALIVGQVLDGSSNQPIAEAIVTMTPTRGGGAGGAAAQAAQRGGGAAAQPPGGGGSIGTIPPQRVMTGPDGRFVFHDLPPGQFQLTASLTGYSANPNANPLAAMAGPAAAALVGLTSAASGSAPVTVPLTEGELATNVRLRLWKDAVISGLVFDDANEPAVGIMVQVARRVMAAGRARYIPGASVRTDDRGAYRIPALAPGSYLVVVPQTQVAIPTSLATGLVDSMTSGRGGGGFALLDVMTSGVNPSEAMQGGVRMGDYMVSSSGSVPVTGADGRLQAYQTIFYPGASGPLQASVVSLKSGEERADVTFNLRLIPTSRVSGTAAGPDGPIANLGVRLVVPADGAMSESEFDVATVVTRGDGTFSFFGVPPGQFLLRAQKMPRPAIPAEAMSSPLVQAMFGGAGPQGPNEALYGAATISVGASDLDRVTLQLTTGLHAIGHLEFESATGRPKPAANQLQMFSIVLTAMDGRMGASNALAAGLSPPDRVNAQGEFHTRGFAPGQYFVSVSANSGWQVKSATVNGRDILDAPLELRDGDANNVVITLTDQLPRVAGTVTASGETDLSDTSVYLVPWNTREWIANGMNPRRARSTRASRTGTYAIPNVPAGEYLIAAVDRVNDGDMQDPAFVEWLSRVGTRAVVGTTERAMDLVKSKSTR